MKQLFKQQALKDLMQYNRWLLIITAVLAVTSALLTLKVVNQQERWVMIPMNDTSKRMVVSSKGYAEIYLREWAFDVMQTLMTTSHDTIEAQVESVKLIARDSTALNQFCQRLQHSLGILSQKSHFSCQWRLCLWVISLLAGCFSRKHLPGKNLLFNLCPWPQRGATAERC